MMNKIFNNFNLLSIIGDLPKDVVKISFVAFTFYLGWTLSPFLFIYLIDHLSISAVKAGFFVSVYAGGSVIGSFFGGKLSDWIGFRRTLLFSLVGTAGLTLMALLVSLSGAIDVLALLLFILSIVTAAFRPAYNTAVIALCDERERGNAYALFVTVINAGAAIGVTLAGALYSLFPGSIFVIHAFSALLASVVIICFVPLPSTRKILKPEASAEIVPGNVRESRQLFFALGGLAIVVLLIEFLGKQEASTIPFYLTDVFNFSAQSWGQLISISHILFIFLMLPVANSVKMMNQYKVATLGVCLIAIGYVLLAQADEPILAAFGYVVIVAGQLPFYPAIVSLFMARACVGKNSGTIMGFYHALQGAASTIAPVLGTVIYQVFGAFYLFSLLSLGAFFAAILLMICEYINRSSKKNC